MAGNSGDTLDPLIEEYKRLSPATIIARKKDEILARLKFAAMCAIQMLDSEWKAKEKPDPEES